MDFEGQVLAELGKLLEAERKKRRISQNQLSRQSGVYRFMIYRLETGEKVRLDTIVRVCRGLGVSTGKLLLEAERKVAMFHGELHVELDGRKKKTCSTCGGERDRPGQAVCKFCHGQYMKKFRAARVTVLRTEMKAAA
jgi:DNA-binding Xre family transcriptional regulator